MDSLWQDLRYAVRALRRSPAYALTVIAVMYGVEANDPVAFGGAAGVVVAITLLASLLPSWRAASTDPIQALRHP